MKIVHLNNYPKMKGEFSESNNDYFYSLYDNYDDLSDYEFSIFPIADITITFGVHSNDVVLLAIIFEKEKFTLEDVHKWLNTYKFKLGKRTDKGFILGAKHVIKGYSFSDNVIILYEKGSKKISYRDIEFNEALDFMRFDNFNILEDKPKKPDSLRIILNKEEINYIPRIDFFDLLICNGTVIEADYVDNYMGNIGFFKSGTSKPKAYVLEFETTIYIDVYTDKFGNRYCMVNFRVFTTIDDF